MTEFNPSYNTQFAPELLGKSISTRIIARWFAASPFGLLAGATGMPIQERVVPNGAGAIEYIARENAGGWEAMTEDQDALDYAFQPSYDEVGIEMLPKRWSYGLNRVRIMDQATILTKDQVSRAVSNIMYRGMLEYNHSCIKSATTDLYANAISGTTSSNTASGSTPYERSFLGDFSLTSAKWHDSTKKMSEVIAANVLPIGSSYLDNLSAFAKLGGYTGNEWNIAPIGMSVDESSAASWLDRQYVALMHPRAIVALKHDPAFMSNTSARGIIERKSQPSALSGSSYVGEYAGIKVYEVEELDYYTISAPNGKKYAWNFLVGQNALGVAHGNNQSIDIIQTPEPANAKLTITGSCVRGHASLVFPAQKPLVHQNIENGLVHFFSAI